ncbi:ABC transporter permease [Porphyromonas macacae]|uniref:ABC transporter permease n=1 Tax=Porphyromonas macacae TaxID=28115 RepID=UPI0035A19889
MKHLAKSFLRMFQGALLLHVIWFVAALLVDKPLLPGPVTVYRSIGTVWEKGLALHLAYSMRRVSVALLIAFGIGIGMALSMYRWPRFGRLMSSFVYFSYPIPKLALLPVVLLLLGMRETPKIVFIVLIILFQIIIALRDSLRSIPEEHFTAVRSMGATYRQKIHYVIFPAILPDALSALRVAIGTAISVLFVAETYGTRYGMGFYIVDSWMRVDYVAMYVAIVLLSLGGFLLFWLTDVVETLVCRWNKYR